MKRLTDRRMILLAAGTVVFAAFADHGAAQTNTVGGTVEFADGAPIPKGLLKVFLKGVEPPKQARGTGAQNDTIESTGKAQVIAFSLDLPSGARATSPRQIVAQLEREDGWLLARGSALIEPGQPVVIELATVMY
ncbi:hypothetical protein [Paracoccus marinaquae]|uniref:CHRD domain-containing protein n=1 Tax=Paracoccus marinaquae TaxID=2841926 RepID=A0ABS6AJI9_9RHOB|nr:hypothetical protein [Paracoccus marinaquae]MBU3030751.1 hypothetical protein [Paracoccus marinaquae]